MVDIRPWGQVAYDAYAEDAGWKSIRGEDLPRWDQQDGLIQRHWDAAAQAILDKLRRG
jgi:hypothetical protein